MKITRAQLRGIIREVLEEKKRPAPEVNLWDAVRAKRARGEKPAKPGEEGYPDEKTWSSATSEGELDEDVRKRGDEWCAYVDDKLTKKEKENNPKKYKGKKVGSVQRTKSGKIRMKARACYRSKKKANNAMAAAMMG